MLRVRVNQYLLVSNIIHIHSTDTQIFLLADNGSLEVPVNSCDEDFKVEIQRDGDDES